MKLYIAVLDEVPSYIVPTLVGHSVIGAHLWFQHEPIYIKWLNSSFKKCVVKVNRKEFSKISQLQNVYLGYENKTLEGEYSCAISLPCEDEDIPNVLKFAKLWKP